MFRSLLATTGVALFALGGCEDNLVFAEPGGETQVVYLNGEPDHCIVVAKGRVQNPAAPVQTVPDPAVAHGR